MNRRSPIFSQLVINPKYEADCYGIKVNKDFNLVFQQFFPLMYVNTVKISKSQSTDKINIDQSIQLLFKNCSYFLVLV